jgi:hypothetical protein
MLALYKRVLAAVSRLKGEWVNRAEPGRLPISLHDAVNCAVFNTSFEESTFLLRYETAGLVLWPFFSNLLDTQYIRCTHSDGLKENSPI